jgi:hypothetical protein
MTELNTLPQVVDVDHYGGDTLTIHVKASDEIIAGREFTAQVRKTKNATRPDATFLVYLRAGFGCDIVLASADCQELTRRGDYEGFWDVQLSMPGGLDPVTTLAHGEMRLHSDVTRAVAT